MIDSGEIIRRVALNAAKFSGLLPFAGRYLGGMGAILMLHRVTSSEPRSLGVNRHLGVTPCFLDAILVELKRLDIEFVTLDEAVDRIVQGASRGGRRFATITADDAYRDNLTQALPVLERHEAPITIYVAPALTDGDAPLWWDVVEEAVIRADRLEISLDGRLEAIDCADPRTKLRAVTRLHNLVACQAPESSRNGIIAEIARQAGIDPRQLGSDVLADWSEIATLSAHPLVTIGAHTMNHHNLKRLGEDAAREEIVLAREVLARRLGRAPLHMAYPYGYESAVGAREVRLAGEAGFRSAVTTRHGLLQPEHASHLLALPRISVNGRYQQVAHLRTMLSGITTPMANRGRRVVTV